MNIQKQRSEGHSEKKKYDFIQKGKGIQCLECEGFGHIQAECATTLKKLSVPTHIKEGRD